MAAISSSKEGASLVLLMTLVTTLKGFQTGAYCCVGLLGLVGRSGFGGGTKMLEKPASAPSTWQPHGKQLHLYLWPTASLDTV